MSRPPLRNVFRLVNSGLEKAALACAAFGLIHATAKADERETVEVALQDQWSNPAAPRAHIDDAWSIQASRSADLDDGWTAPGARRSRLAEQVVVTNPVPTRVETLIANATPSTLANDRSDWNDTPRARSPGLIAANTAWRGREKTGADWNNAPVKPVEPIQAKTPDKPVFTDPWLAPQAASTRALESSAQDDLGRGSVDGWTNPHALQTSPSMQGDWSIFAKTSCLDSTKQDASSNDRKSSKPRGQAKSISALRSWDSGTASRRCGLRTERSLTRLIGMWRCIGRAFRSRRLFASAIRLRAFKRVNLIIDVAAGS